MKCLETYNTDYSDHSKIVLYSVALLQIPSINMNFGD